MVEVGPLPLILNKEAISMKIHIYLEITKIIEETCSFFLFPNKNINFKDIEEFNRVPILGVASQEVELTLNQPHKWKELIQNSQLYPTTHSNRDMGQGMRTISYPLLAFKILDILHKIIKEKYTCTKQ